MTDSPASAPQPAPTRVLATLAWLLPAAFLATTGVAKWIEPRGTAPAALRFLTELAPWSTWLRGMGAFELLVAGLLAWRSTRAWGRGVAFALVAGLTLLVVLNAHDARFVADCGCLGTLASRNAPRFDLELLLLRNATILALLLLSARLAVPGVSAGQALRAAGAWGAVILLAGLFAAEKMRWADLRDQREATERGRTFAARLGLALPEVQVADQEGRAGPLSGFVAANDRVLVVSTTCPHCATLAPEAHGLARHVAPLGGRVVLLVIEDGGPRAKQWVSDHGLADLPWRALERHLDARLLGVEGVPALIVLGPDRRTVAHPEHGGFTSTADALAALGDSGAAAREGFWASLARRLGGEQARAGEAARRPDGSWEAPLRLPGDAVGRLVLRSDGRSKPSGLELAVGLGPDGRVLGLVALGGGSQASMALSDLEQALAPLSGSTVAQARDELRRQAQSGLLLPGLLASAHVILERLGEGASSTPAPSAPR